MKKSELLRTIETLFWENSFSDLSMDQIAAHLGMKKASLYYHFPSKEAMFVAVLEQSYERYREFLRWVLIPPTPLIKGGVDGGDGGILAKEGNDPELVSEEWGDNFGDDTIMDKGRLKEYWLISTGFHLPYNPKLIERAKELRKNMTEPEKKLWFGFLRKIPPTPLTKEGNDPELVSMEWGDKALEGNEQSESGDNTHGGSAAGGIRKIRFLRQRPIDNYIVDFYCPELRLVIEIDGESHFTQEGKDYDIERTAVLEGYGLSVLRFTNSEVMRNFEGVCETILSRTESPLPPLLRGETSGASGGIIPAVGETSGATDLDELIASLIRYPLTEHNLFAIVSQKGYCQIEEVHRFVRERTQDLQTMIADICRERFSWRSERSFLFISLTDALAKRCSLERCEDDRLGGMVAEIKALFFSV